MADDDVARLIRRADDALYVSKKAGRNCGHWNTGRQHVPITTPETAEPSPLPAEDVTNPEEGASVAETDNRVETPSVPNGATFVQMLKRRVAESHRFGIPISVMYLKIEEFDIVNRKYGSPTARQMVDAAASEFQKALREMDIIANLENGEFVVMFPGSAQTEVCYVVKRMRAITANCILRLVDRKLQIRFRHGIAELKPNETAKELLARARQTLNAALSPEPVEG